MDQVNCGIFSCNAIAHAIFGDALVTPATVQRNRLQWFAHVVESLEELTLSRIGTVHSTGNSSDDVEILEPSPYLSKDNVLDDSLSSSSDIDMAHEASPASSNPPSDTEHELDISFEEPPTLYPQTTVVDSPATAVLPHPHSSRIHFINTDSGEESTKEADQPETKSTNMGKTKKKCRINMGAREAKRQAKKDEFEREVLHDDPKAQFGKSDPLEVRCSYCRNTVRMQREYNLVRWKHHFNRTCPKRHSKVPGRGIRTIKAAGAKSLALFGFEKASTTSKVRPQSKFAPPPTTLSAVNLRPCPGLTAFNEPRIAIYLSRTQARGGGGTDPRVIAERRFDQLLSELSDPQKEECYAENRAGWVWRNEHQERRCVAVDCRKMVEGNPGSDKARPCDKCRALLCHKGFQNLVAKEMPTDQNLVHVPYLHRASAIGQLFARSVGLQSFFNNEVRFRDNNNSSMSLSHLDH